MTESTSRSDREKPSSTLNKLSDQPDCREAQRYVVAPRTVIMLHTNLLSHRKQDCKGHEHRAEGCSGACSHLRFFSSAAQSGEEHLHREETGENAFQRTNREKEREKGGGCHDVELVRVYKAVTSRTEHQRDELHIPVSLHLHLSHCTSKQNPAPILRMQKCIGGVCISLVFCAVLTETLGMVIAAKEKRGWTLNSAGYLLGPRRIDHLIQIKEAPSARGREELLGEYGIDSHRTLSDKHGLAGKRDALMEDEIKSGALRIADEDIVHTIVDFLSYLKLKDMGALDSLPASLTSDEFTQP
ncbi:hypothetical protein QTP70_020577 [Hemibagrus guttatus]|uniref:Galanin peptides n=1 Tax=Hemibagrus guttatus TaxID=175788 RepID=A0AAE0QWU8_9TELE|nr:hypothetical protein QTP70_020577 [Hemibagrus guttatus]